MRAARNFYDRLTTNYSSDALRRRQFIFRFVLIEGKLVDVGVDFFRTFLQQYVAYRRVDPSLLTTALTAEDVAEAALPTDYEAITSLLESFAREKTSADELTFLRFCLQAPQKLAAATKRPLLPLIDCLPLADESDTGPLAKELTQAFLRRTPFVAMAGLRRQMPNAIHAAGADLDADRNNSSGLSGEDDAHMLLDALTRSVGVESNEQTRDLIVQQVHGSPFFLAALAQAAREKRASLTSFLECQRLYVDELLGGRIHRHFAGLLNQIAPQAQTRRTLVRVLYESALSETRKASVWTWKKTARCRRLHEFERIIDALHVHELANSSGATIELNSEPPVWMDYLHAQYQLEVAGEAARAGGGEHVAEYAETRAANHASQVPARSGARFARHPGALQLSGSPGQPVSIRSFRRVAHGR